MPASALQQTIAHYRAALLSHEAAAQHALDYAHARTLEAIAPQLDILYRAMAMKLQAGDTIPLEWLYEGRRLEAIKAMIANQIDHFGALAQMQTGRLQHLGVQLGQQAGLAALNASTPIGVNWSFGIPSPKAINDLIGATQAGSPLADLFSGFGSEAAQEAGQALITGITLGYNPRTIEESVQQALGISRNRALVISRQEMLRAYKSANLETFRANSDVIDGWVWQAALDRRTCAVCIAMNGSEHSLDESMDSHICCRCVQVPKTKGWDDILSPLGIDTSDMEEPSVNMESGSDWFDNQDAATQKAILGSNAAYDLFQSGKVTLKDFVGVQHDPSWGTSRYQRSVKQLTKARK